MRAIRIHEVGGTLVPTYEEVLLPKPGPGQVLVKRSDEVFAWVREGSLRVRVDTAFPLAQAVAAHRYLEGRKTRGKVLLIPEQSRSSDQWPG